MDAGCISEQLLSQAPVCTWLVDSGYRFVRIFGDSAPIFGLASSLLTKVPLSEALPAEAAATWRDRVDRCVVGETLRLREFRAACTFYVQLFPVRDWGRTLAGGFALDVTPWSTADQELRYTVLGALRSQEYSRATMSKFLHDSVGQNLSASGLQLDMLRMDLEGISPESVVKIGEIQQMLEEVVEQVREFSYELNPSMVERAGLRPALDRLAGKLRDRFHGTLRLIFDPSTKVPLKYANAFYQIVQEAVENSLQHSSCSMIEIAVKSTKTGPSLEVRDNGRGFEPAAVVGGRRGLGLLTMEHFAAQAGLDMSISSTREHGTVVRASVAAGSGT